MVNYKRSMEKRNISLNKYIYPVVFLAFLQGCSAYRSSAKQDQGIVKPEYYSVGDFTSVEKIDSHIHFNVTDSAFTEQSEKDNFRLLNIVDDRPFERTHVGRASGDCAGAGTALARQSLLATTIPSSNWNNDNWENETVTFLKDAISKGAIAVKVWKNIGMDLKDKNGKFVMIDNPRFDPIFDYLAKNKITLIGHNGEPKDCWLPLEKMTVKGNRSYYGQHPEYHMYLHPEYPSYEDRDKCQRPYA